MIKLVSWLLDVKLNLHFLMNRNGRKFLTLLRENEDKNKILADIYTEEGPNKPSSATCRPIHGELRSSWKFKEN